MAQIKFALFSFLLTTHSLFAWDAPWKHSRDSVSPWTSEARRENREGFFDKLSRDSEPEAKENVQKSPRVESEDSEGATDLQDIPWTAHQTLYPSDRFSSHLLWPISGGRLASGYGIRAGHFHEGLDISSQEGSTIYATADGRVVYSGRLGTYGKIMVVYHGDGIASVYAHNSQNLKAKGSRVMKGDAIARVGQSGRAEGPHCHFEIRKDGKPINPLQFVYAKTIPSKRPPAEARAKQSGRRRV